jgi:DNA-binding LacI/PurR family transcriptional regulator
MAVGAIRALREAALRVPDDVSIIGFDDIPLASYFDPPLTTIRQPTAEAGTKAVRVLVETIQNPERTQEQISVQARLVERASCALVPL